jgi:hypothetical protein
LLSCSIFADIVVLELLQRQGLDNNLSLQSASAGFPPNPLGGFIEVHKPGSQTQDINVNPLSEKEELPPVASRLSIYDEEDYKRLNMLVRTARANHERCDRLRPSIATDVGRQQKGHHTWWGPSLGGVRDHRMGNLHPSSW